MKVQVTVEVPLVKIPPSSRMFRRNIAISDMLPNHGSVLRLLPAADIADRL
ncbi:MAG: hypothetical protein M3Z36_11330 [Acidobacteriota bacterium]|nr:hypothetical protein [Acidobacteriota bacterium]